jgi:hypothetical protein
MKLEILKTQIMTWLGITLEPSHWANASVSAHQIEEKLPLLMNLRFSVTMHLLNLNGRRWWIIHVLGAIAPQVRAIQRVIFGYALNLGTGSGSIISKSAAVKVL